MRYEEKGIDLSIYHASMLDLKWKLMETNRVYGIWGVHCGDWFRPFFQAERFALGRLQFEVIVGYKMHQTAKTTYTHTGGPNQP